MIEIQGLSFGYREESQLAISGLTCQFEAHGLTAIVGRSGVGKSTLLALLAGIYAKGDPAVGTFAGNILLNGQRPTEIRGASRISWVPQHAVLLDHLTVLDNVLLSTARQEARDASEERAIYLLKRLDLENYESKRPRDLSGGMRTRVAFARALLSDPEYLFLDEPFSSLDLGSRWNLYEIVVAERAKTGLCTILTTHNIPEAMLLADRVVLLSSSEATRLERVLANQRPDFINAPRIAALAEARARALDLEGSIY